MTDGPKRGLGPFTGGQLTTIACVVVLAVGFPVGAWAVAGSNAFITDAGSGAHAKVSRSGSLTVGGSVFTSPAAPKSLYHNYATISGSQVAAVATAPAGATLVLTSLNINAVGVNGISPDSIFDISTTSTCTGPLSFVVLVTSPTIGWTSVSIPSGLAIPPHGALCAGETSSLNAEASTFGYVE